MGMTKMTDLVFKAPFNFNNSKRIKDLVIGYLPEAFEEGASELDLATLKVAKT